MATGRRCREDRGGTLVEAAIATPVLMLFVFAIFEFGFAFRDYLTVASATRDGAREASVSGDVRDTDFRILDAIEDATSAIPRDSIDMIVVYKASGPGDPVPAACLGGSVAGVCNHYTPAQFDLAVDDFGCSAAFDPVPDPDRFYCPEDRQTSLLPDPPGLEYVGVHLRVTRNYITGLFGSSITFEDTTVLKVEPRGPR